MSSAGKEGAASRRFNAVMASVAIVVSFFVLTILVSADAASIAKLRERRILATIVPASGELIGVNALDGSEWVPSDHGNHVVVLFGVAQAGAVGDMDFWRKVVSSNLIKPSDFSFVGLCAEPACSPPPESDGLMTVLRLMDPAQTHALTTGASRRRAFFYRSSRGSKVQGMLQIPDDPQVLALKLAGLVKQRSKSGTT